MLRVKVSMYSWSTSRTVEASVVPEFHITMTIQTPSTENPFDEDNSLSGIILFV